MEFVNKLGYLALGSRMKSLSDRLYDLADAIYQREGIAIQARWFPLLRMLQDRGPQPVGEIALAIGQTHSAVSQIANKLRAAKLLRELPTRSDRRMRLLALTPTSESILKHARPVWLAIEASLAQRSAQANLDLLGGLHQFAQMLDDTLANDIAQRCRSLRAKDVQIIPFEAADRSHFYRLNAEWLQRFFYLEEIDHRVLANPEAEILNDGGTILYARSGDDIVGTCALKREAPGVYELTKMAVTEHCQGLGIGRKLIDAIIETFKQKRGKTLFLETHSKLVSAIRLYENSGFEHQPAGKPDSHYQRSNVYMIWRPEAARTV